MNSSPTIRKLSETETDNLSYTNLRKQGIDYITELGNKFWTDFNIHDPGITILEALCYALTDLTYRTRFPTADLLSAPPGAPANPQRQGFFSARTILTVNPWTPLDFRKLLIDVVGVRNAWIFCKCCPCEMFLYADCAKSQLVYEPTEHPVVIRGLYDVLLEFDEEAVGDLNSGKIKYNLVFATTNTATTTATIEARLPSWHFVQQNKAKFANFRKENSAVTGVAVKFISGNKNDNSDIPTDELARALRRPLYATIEIKFKPDKNQATEEILALDDVPIRVWFKSTADRQAFDLTDIKEAIEDSSTTGIAAHYLDLLHRADAVVAEASAQLHSHRNLAEDYCSIDAIDVVDVGICLDLEVKPDADIEALLAEAYYEIGEYFAPEIQFYSLSERLAAGKTPDEIFNGPPLNSGFLDDDQLASTQLKSTLYASDVINILMDIDGVVAVKNFVFILYDQDGFALAPSSWSVEIPALHQPRLYIEGSKILVFKGKLPFLPDQQELSDTLQFVKGQNSKTSLTIKDLDLLVPAGVYSDLAAAPPLQQILPQTYGVGADGLPPTASAKRRGQAKQLAGYLLFFEQLLINYLFQLKNLGELFALDTNVTHTYYTTKIGTDRIPNVNELLAPALTDADVQGLCESESDWLDRRNRFLDHMLARFGETFSDYALMLYSVEVDKKLASAQLIENKIAFLKEYPSISANRGRSFDYKDPAHVCSSDNIAGLKRRIQLLLGMAEAEKLFIVEHVLVRPRNQPGGSFPEGDPLLPICIPSDCSLCGEEDPYSFRLSIVMAGDSGKVGSDLNYRRFAEETIRLETPAHLAVKVCWVESGTLDDFEDAYCEWLKILAEAEPDPAALHDALKEFLKIFTTLKNVYPPATLHDCFEGSEGNEVFLGQTVIPKSKPD